MGVGVKCAVGTFPDRKADKPEATPTGHSDQPTNFQHSAQLILAHGCFHNEARKFASLRWRPGCQRSTHGAIAALFSVMHVTQRDGSVQATQAQVVQFARNRTCAHAVLTLRDVAPMTPVLSGPSAWPASSATIFSPNCATRAGLHSRAIRSRRR